MRCRSQQRGAQRRRSGRLHQGGKAGIEAQPGLGAERGQLADVVTRYGAWADHDVTVCGSPAMIRSTVSRMLVAGTPLAFAWPLPECAAGDSAGDLADDVAAAVSVGQERDTVQDVALGLRQLTDVAARLSAVVSGRSCTRTPGARSCQRGALVRSSVSILSTPRCR